jgi:hypothetical protein
MKAPLSLVSVNITLGFPLVARNCNVAFKPALGGPAMSEVVRQNAVGDQLLDVADALVTRPFELIEREARLPIGGVELLGAATCIELWLEGGEYARDLVEVDAVRAYPGFVRRDLESATWHHFGNDIGDIADRYFPVWPTLKASLKISSSEASSAAMKAREMSSM